MRVSLEILSVWAFGLSVGVIGCFLKAVLNPNFYEAMMDARFSLSLAATILGG